MDVTQIDLLRHGECEGGAIFRGSTNTPLLAAGFSRMQRVCQSYRGRWDCVVSSPLQRCCSFAEHLTSQHGLPLQIDERLREMSFGDWENQTTERVWRNDQTRYSAWMTDPAQCSPPNGESLTDLMDRVDQSFQAILDEHRGKKLLLVTHGGVVRVLLARALDIPLARINTFDVPYACVSRILVLHDNDGDRTRLIAHNFGSFGEIDA